MHPSYNISVNPKKNIALIIEMWQSEYVVKKISHAQVFKLHA